MKCLLMFILFYSKFSFYNTSEARYQIIITHIDNFPHNIDKDFTIDIHHPDIKTHHIYAVIILEVVSGELKESQQIYLYPGFIPKLDRRLKEHFFHVMHFETKDFRTVLVVRFYRDSQGGEFSVFYSAMGAKNIHMQMPTDSMLIYKEIIHLFRPPVINLNIKSDDGHEGGLSIDKRGLITCTSADGFPKSMIELKFDKSIQMATKNKANEDIIEIEFVAQLKNHLNNVTCKSGGVSVSKQINVFHHPTAVNIFPEKKSYLKQGSVLECRSSGNGFPTPSVRWSIHLNQTTQSYFTISQKDSVSYLQINSNVPNRTQWQFNCSSLNVIPPLDRGGPFKLINITIGENPESAKLASARIWTITMAVVVFLIICFIGILCFGSRFQCKPRSKSKNLEPSDTVSLRADYTHVDQHEHDVKAQYYKDECTV